MSASLAASKACQLRIGSHDQDSFHHRSAPVVRNELFLHRETIVEKFRKLPGCDQVRGLALRSN